MAAIRRKHGKVALASSATVLFCDTGTYEGWGTVTLPEGQTEGKKEEEEERLTENGGNRILASAFSPSGQYFGVCDNQKQLHLYKTGQEWTLVSTRSVVKRGKSVAFTQDEERVILSDKSGDVYSFSVSQPDSQGELTHGHLSMVLDMVLARDDQYVVTCDRDEKIRVSNFPNSYNIYSFCLGHTDFVTCLSYVEEDDVLLSGSGDTTIRAWSLEGKQLNCTKTGAIQPPDTDQAPDTTTRPAVQKMSYCPKHRLLAVAFYGYPSVEVYRLAARDEGCSLTLQQCISLTVDPWDISFDGDGNLWLVQPVEGSTLQVYRSLPDGGHSVKLSEIGESEKTLYQIQMDVNSKWDMFQGCLATPSTVPTLWKQRVDNMSEYLKRKQQRLTENKEGGDNSNTDSPPEKATKAS
ncbi:tRNA (guanine-N(7)-)-methyltransferase non-catalytic subunit wdr4-like [Haliotis rufescens]|uniref:tRNA (guanine-N(7)-)-methyltransferase non-catalytic subunit wdr4-like n=1 Tax=Haliotis rufescens TaxID=6454 RepID=UPI00201F1F0E|nr:tRNA (guanine-N(7)-)-methyltransferase non-catalytic subunit wdr4-like [Haliotis rufescens]